MAFEREPVSFEPGKAFDLTGRTAIVTGAACGVGRGIAIGFARAGARLVLADINEQGMEETAQRIRETGGMALPVRADINETRDRRALVDAALAEKGRIDVLVNAAAAAPQFTTALETTEEDWDDALGSGLKGLFFLTLETVRRAMIPQGRGAVINISSNAGYGPVPLHAAYGIMKGGVNTATAYLGSEFGPRGVRVNGLAPRLVKYTEMAEEHWADPDRLARAAGKSALGYVPEPKDLIGAAVFLASDASAYVNGQMLLCDGGLSIGIL